MRRRWTSAADKRSDIAPTATRLPGGSVASIRGRECMASSRRIARALCNLASGSNRVPGPAGQSSHRRGSDQAKLDRVRAGRRPFRDGGGTGSAVRKFKGSMAWPRRFHNGLPSSNEPAKMPVPGASQLLPASIFSRHAESLPARSTAPSPNSAIPQARAQCCPAGPTPGTSDLSAELSRSS